MGNRIYGCDDCLAVCPWNKYAQAGREAKLAAREALRAPQLGGAGASRRRGLPRAVHEIAGEAHRPRPLHPQCADRDRQLRRRRARGRRRAAARRCVAAGARRGGVGARRRLDPARLAAHAAQHAAAKPIPPCARNGRPRSKARRPEWRRCSASASAIARAFTSPNSARASSASSAHRARRSLPAPVEMLTFDAAAPSDEVRSCRRGGNASPDFGRRRAKPAIRSSPRSARRSRRRRSLEAIVYLSSLGVYGDHGGAWVGRDRDDDPGACARRRAACRRAGLAGARSEARRSGRRAAARRHLWTGTERVHAAPRRARTPRRQARTRVQPHPRRPTSRRRSTPRSRTEPDGIFNVTDDEPAAYSDQVLLAAKLLGVDPPKELSMEEAREVLTPMALSFYAGCVRVKNDKLKTRARRDAALSDLSRRPARAVRRRLRSARSARYSPVMPASRIMRAQASIDSFRNAGASASGSE